VTATLPELSALPHAYTYLKADNSSATPKLSALQHVWTYLKADNSVEVGR
jgi:hypothetical protein